MVDLVIDWLRFLDSTGKGTTVSRIRVRLCAHKVSISLDDRANRTYGRRTTRYTRARNDGESFYLYFSMYALLSSHAVL